MIEFIHWPNFIKIVSQAVKRLKKDSDNEDCDN